MYWVDLPSAGFGTAGYFLDYVGPVEASGGLFDTDKSAADTGGPNFDDQPIGLRRLGHRFVLHLRAEIGFCLDHRLHGRHEVSPVPENRQRKREPRLAAQLLPPPRALSVSARCS